jgi:hypothetical protein
LRTDDDYTNRQRIQGQEPARPTNLDLVRRDEDDDHQDKTHRAVSKCVYRLRTRVDEGFFGPRSIVGHFGQTSVRLRKRIGYRSWFQPQVKVDLVEESTQTLLRCRLGVHPLSAWLTHRLFAAMTIAAAMMPEGDGFGSRTLLMLVAFALLYLGFLIAEMGATDLADYLRVTLYVGTDKRALMDWPFRWGSSPPPATAKRLLRQGACMSPRSGVPPAIDLGADIKSP